MRSSDELIERLAKAEHDQWADWASQILATEPGISQERKDRWERLIQTPYQVLTDEEKKVALNRARRTYYVADTHYHGLFRDYRYCVGVMGLVVWLTTMITGLIIALIGVPMVTDTTEGFALFFIGMIVILYAYVNMILDYYIDLWEFRRVFHEK